MGFAPDVPDPIIKNYLAVLHGVPNEKILWETLISRGRVSLHAVKTTVPGILKPRCEVKADQAGGACVPCRGIKYKASYPKVRQYIATV